MSQRSATPLVVRAGGIDDAEDVVAVILDAGSLFREAGMTEVADNPPPPLERVRAQAAGGRVWVAVADDRVVGCIITGVLDGHAHVDQVSVARPYQGRGIGRRLITTAETQARVAGHGRITLTTFSEVPWNAPYYARLGYRVMSADELGPELAAERMREAAAGVDRWGRCAMVRTLSAASAGRHGQRTRPDLSALVIAGLLGILLVGCDAEPDPSTTAGGAPRNVGQLVHSWGQGQGAEMADLQALAPPSRVVVVADAAERERLRASSPLDQGTLAGVDLAASLVVLGGYPNCHASSHLAFDPARKTVTFTVTRDEKINCAWAPYTVDAFEVARSELGGLDPGVLTFSR